MKKLDLLETKVIQPLTELESDFLIKVIKSLDESLDEEEIKHEVLKFLDVTPEKTRIFSGINSIKNYMKTHCTPVQQNEIKDEWQHGMEKYVHAINHQEKFPKDVIIPLQEIIGISNTTMEIFYAAGLDLYHQHHYKTASDVFFFLINLSHLYYNMWISFALAEQKQHHYPTALNAFAMAIMINIDSPEPYLHAAECCMKMNDTHEAKQYLQDAMDRINRDTKRYYALQNHALEIKKKIY